MDLSTPTYHPLPHRHILGMRVDASNYSEATALIIDWAGQATPPPSLRSKRAHDDGGVRLG